MTAFYAGAARRVVTPNPLLPVSSGADACRPAEKQQGELELRVLVVASDETRAAIASVPFLGFPSRLCERVREKVTAIPRNSTIRAVILSSVSRQTQPAVRAYQRRLRLHPFPLRLQQLQDIRIHIRHLPA